MARHLGNAEELIDFLMNMNEQLVKHKKEKTPLGDYDLFQTVNLAIIQEINPRLKKILKLSRELRHSKNRVRDQNEIKKQTIHCANYLLMIFCKARIF